jgi:hypothetical protein
MRVIGSTTTRWPELSSWKPLGVAMLIFQFSTRSGALFGFGR